MRQITASEAKAYMRDIEARLKTIYNLAHLPEKPRRQILTLASGANIRQINKASSQRLIVSP